MDEAVVLDVPILLAMEAERPLLGGPGSPGLVLTLPSGGVQVELSEPVFLVGPLFLAGHSVNGRSVRFFWGGTLFPGGGNGNGVDLGPGLEMSIFVDLEIVRNFWDSEVVKLVADFFWQPEDEGTDKEQLTFVGPAGLERVDQILLVKSKAALQVAIWMESLYFSFSPRWVMAR